MSFQYTREQQQAISSRGSSLLVSAAAGSGKTRVLTQRLMSYVSDPDSPQDIDRFLVITYTRAAAAELRGRIIQELGALAAADPTDRRLRRQQNLCYHAQIGTIHSFCTTLLRENCHHLGLAPSFKVMDEDRAETMKNSILSRLLDERYESIARDEAFRLLADTVGAGRDDRRLIKTVLSLHSKLQSHPYPDAWAAKQASMLKMEDISDVGESIWGREILDGLGRSARFWAERMEAALAEIYSADEKIIKAYGESFAQSAEALRDFSRALDQGWDRARSFLPIPFPRIGALRNYAEPEKADRLKLIRAGAKKAAESFSAALSEDSASQLSAMKAMAPAMISLLELCMDFDRRYAAEKKRQGYLDFSDLEHYAAQLLVDKESGAPTWIAVELSQRFTEIMVDEYQDVNAVQDMIFNAISRQGSNLFMVGDVKQSIYRFRLADPGIFLEKYRTYAPIDTAEPGTQPRRILLQENFRSRKCVLDAVNLVFSNIMSRELGELDYDSDAALRYGAPDYDEKDDSPAEFVIIDPDDSGDEEDSPRLSELEARFVADRIRRMVDRRAQVRQGAESRDCRYGDFVILMRSPSGKGIIFHRALAEAGIPVQSQQGGAFFTSLEVTVAINLLNLIDNPHADVPLISVLRSPVFGFSPDELSAIRACDRKSDYFGAVCAAAEKGDSRCREFLDKLSTWRALAPDMGLDALIWRIYNDTGLFAICSAMSEGERRRGNLMLLFQYARSFQATGYRGVFRFTAWLRRMAERGTEPESGSDENSVRIMSIHKSKGLEFPFVFLCDLSHQFNKSDLRENVLLHSQLGLGPKFTDMAMGLEYPTIARRAIEQRLLSESLSEEMRVLYVAMTRAKEKLIMSCAWKNAENAMEKLRLSLASPIAPEQLRAASGFDPWLAMCSMLSGGLIKTSIIRGVGSVTAEPEVTQAEAAADEACYQRIHDKLSFRYPFPQAVDLPSKLTATGIKGRIDEGEMMEESAALAGAEAPEFSFRLPELSGASRLSATQRGTATHSFLQFARLSQLDTAQGIDSELSRLCAAGHLSAEEAQAVDRRSVLQFFTSPIGREMLSAGELKREFRFTLLADASDFFPVPPGEELLLQGIVDCFFISDGGITIVDYKTDRIAAPQVAQRAEGYAPQLRAYAMALERIMGLPVKRCVLYFLHPGVEYPLKIL